LKVEYGRLEPKVLVDLNAQRAGGLGRDGVQSNAAAMDRAAIDQAWRSGFFALPSNITTIPTQPSGPLGVQNDENLRF